MLPSYSRCFDVNSRVQVLNRVSKPNINMLIHINFPTYVSKLTITRLFLGPLSDRPWIKLILAIDDSKFSHATSLVLRCFLLLLDLNRAYSKQIYTNGVSTNQGQEIRASNQSDEPISASISEVEVKEEPNTEEFIEYPEDEAISRVSPPKKARLHGQNNSNESQDGPGSSDTDPGSSSSQGYKSIYC